MTGVLCFGGPLDGQAVATEHPNGPLLTAWPPKPTERGPVFEIVEYHRGRIGFDGHEWDCWIAPHYPEDRVIDSLETIHALARMAAGWR